MNNAQQKASPFPFTSRLMQFATAALMLAFLAVPASAQSTTSSLVDAQMEIVQGLSFVKDADIDFGRVPSGVGDVTLDAKTGGINHGDGATTVGSFHVTGTADESVSVSFAATTDLTETGGSTVSYEPTVTTSDNGAQSTSTAYTSGGTTALSSTGERYFYIGGDVNVPNGQPGGTYTGSVTFDVSYTSL